MIWCVDDDSTIRDIEVYTLTQTGFEAKGFPDVKQFSGKTEAVVRKKLKEYKKSCEYAEKRLPTSETIRSFFETWLKEVQYNKLKPSSYDRLERTLQKNVFPYIGA